MEILEFPDLLALIDERSSAFRAAVASAPDLDVPVPSCPEWTLFDLAQHLGEGHSWRLCWLSADGARITRLSTPGAEAAAAAGEDPAAVADAAATGTASELVLVFYGRVPLESLALAGDRQLFDLLVSWDPEA